MKPKKFSDIESSTFFLLEKTNEEFTKEWQKCQNSENEPRFQNCIKGYKKIKASIQVSEKNNPSSQLLKSYYLEAWLGEIQSQLNDLPQNPCNENIVLSNDEKIKTLKKSLSKLHRYLGSNPLDQEKKDGKFLTDYKALCDKIANFFLLGIK